MRHNWNLPKVHYLNHFANNITLFGPLVHQDVEIGEKSHKYHGKCVATMAQKWIEKFPEQCANRKHDQIIVKTMRGKMNGSLKWGTKKPQMESGFAAPSHSTKFCLVLIGYHTNRWETIRALGLTSKFDLQLEERFSSFLCDFFFVNHINKNAGSISPNSVPSEMVVHCTKEVMSLDPRDINNLWPLELPEQWQGK